MTQIRRSTPQIAAVTVTTAATALYSAAIANTNGLKTVTVDAEGAVSIGFDPALVAANGIRIAAGEKASVDVEEGARLYAITAAGTAVVRVQLGCG